MVRADVIEMFGAITSMYPSATAFAQATDSMITTWWKMLSDLPKQSVAIALKQHASVSTFPPSIAEIRKGVAELKAAPYKSGIEEWNEVAHALRNSAYRADEEFAKLSPIARRLVGSPMQLKEWGCAEDVTVLSVAKSQFLKSYDILVKREQEQAQLPESIRKLIGCDPIKELVENITEELGE